MKKLEITSPAFAHKKEIPPIYSCDGEGINPPLEFHNIPNGTVSLVLVVDDPDASGKSWTHWLVLNIPPSINRISQNCMKAPGIEAFSDFGTIGYGAICPPSGPHRYCFKLYALSKMLIATEDITRPELENLMRDSIIEKAELVGIYSRD